MTWRLLERICRVHIQLGRVNARVRMCHLLTLLFDYEARQLGVYYSPCSVAVRLVRKSAGVVRDGFVQCLIQILGFGALEGIETFAMWTFAARFEQEYVFVVAIASYAVQRPFELFPCVAQVLLGQNHEIVRKFNVAFGAFEQSSVHIVHDEIGRCVSGR